ncbi:lipase family protein [Burkholderia pseudomallei]|uniref:lipase family protein n=1 Tax=Burkholderia pseudomallei TaxID=28450 RepID=UPI000F05AF22|nr:lipase family protein [Burkholderia pseudomallei]CAJ2711987.1 lipase, class 3 [Burkholderia pseudomallei]CAJ4674124.1 lipase, class 3 [Burkholderia pseudomallei]VBM95050.1 lipase, class 3 [Burkholderia pseudomallei]VBX79319.1 lipase, class 3 [Burkholderia pseudomallei]VBX79341.1 lipase, class 3 [Burkholderia pseudomallei]
MTPHDYALLAQEAYTAKPDIGSAPGPSCAIVRQTPAGLVIAFPGTDSFADLLADFDVTPDAVPGLGHVHGGFWNAYAAIQGEVIAAASGQEVIFVGHSLGAALAIVSAASFVANGNPVKAVWGFAPPRVSPEPSISAVLAKTPMALYRNGNDAVPAVPPLWPQSGSLIQIGKAALPFINLKDHALARYINALTAMESNLTPAA